MARFDNGTAYPVYDAGNPPPYPVTSVAGLTGAVAFLNTQIVTEDQTQKVKILFPVESVDGLTGTVKTWANSANETLKTPAASEGDRWGLARECPSGDIGIRFTYDSNNGVQGYLVFSDGQNPETALRILTPADIPQSAVVSVNGQAGIVVLYATDLQMSNGDATTIPQAINSKAPIESLAIPIVGNVASVNVAAGKFVYVKNSTITGIPDGLYNAVNAISANTAFTAADLDNTNTAEGGLNALNSKTAYQTNETQVGIWTNGKPIYRRIVSGTLPNTEGSIILTNIGNIDFLVSAHFILETATFFVDNTVYAGTDTTKLNFGFVDKIGDVRYKSYVSNYFGGTVTAILEYTKP